MVGYTDSLVANKTADYIEVACGITTNTRKFENFNTDVEKCKFLPRTHHEGPEGK
jgi:major membrane immunogen (membrane-anchored lipoprotein)